MRSTNDADLGAFRAGAARLSLAPPLGLPMIGFFRQRSGGTGYGWPLEVTSRLPAAT